MTESRLAPGSKTLGDDTQDMIANPPFAPSAKTKSALSGKGWGTLSFQKQQRIQCFELRSRTRH